MYLKATCSTQWLARSKRQGSFRSWARKPCWTLLTKLAACSKPRISRRQHSRTTARTPLNLDALLKHGNLSVNTQLSPGDTILVPLDLKRVYAFGDVTRPGYNMYQDGNRVLDALSAVELNSDAETNKVNVVHVNNQTKTAVLQIVNLQDFLWHGKLDGNPLLQPGDVIYIPKRTVPFSIESLVYGLAGSVSSTKSTR